MRRYFSLLALSLSAGYAQNSDLGLLGGISGPEAQIVTGPVTRISGSVGGSGQVNYAFQVHSADRGNLFVELPLVITGHSEAIVGPTIVALSHGAIFFTPGVRFKLPLHSRVALYGALGGGVGAFGREVAQVGNGVSVITERWKSTPVLDFGGGLDFRLTRLLSLRGEVRDFVTRADFAGSAGHHHSVFQVGVGFHF